MPSHPHQFNWKHFLLFACLFFSFKAFSQISISDPSSISHYAVYTGLPINEAYSSSSTPQYGSLLARYSNVYGNIGSQGLICTSSQCSVTGDMHSAGQIVIGNGTFITGDMTAAYTVIPYPNSNKAIKSGHSLDLNGNIISDGDVRIEYYYDETPNPSSSTTGSTINGSVTIAEDASYYGPTPNDGLFIGGTVFPNLPDLPEVSSFAAFGSQNITEDATLLPGVYKNIQLAGQKKITFSGPGTYVFKKIKNSGQTNQFKFDFQNDPTGVFVIQVHEDVDLARIRVLIVNGGDASRIFMEVHGSGSSQWGTNFACIMKNGNETYNTQSSWKGTIYAPYGGIYMGRGNGFSQVEGGLWSNSRVVLNKYVSVTGNPYFFPECESPIASAGADMTLNCIQDTLQLDGSASSPNTEYLWETEDGHIISGADGLSPVIDEQGTYLLTVTVPGTTCSSTDIVEVNSNFNPPDIYVNDDQYLGCGDEDVILWGASEFNNVTYEWSTENGEFYPGEDPSEINAVSAGIYVLTITRNNNGCSVSDSVEVFQEEIPIAYGGEDQYIGCGVWSLFLYGSSNSEDPYTYYYWSSEDGQFYYDEDPSVIEVYSAGTYVLHVGIGEGECYSTDTVIVFQNTEGPGAYAGEDQYFSCDDESLFLYGTTDSEDPYLYINWSSEDGEFTNNDDPALIEVYTPGTYILYVGYPESPCFSIDTVVVFPDFEGPGADAGPDMVINCDSYFVTLIGSSDSEDVEFEWSSEDGDFSVAEDNDVIDVYSAGTYVLTVTDLESGCQSMDTAIVTEDTEGPFVNAGPPKALSCYFNDAVLAGSVDDEEANFYWSTENGNIVSGADELDPLVDAVGTYYLHAFYGEGSCESIDSTIVVQNPCILPVYPPIRKGKVNEKIGSELTSLYENYFENSDTLSQIFRIIDDSVYIEVITLEGFTAEVMDLLVQSPTYGMTDFIPNGLTPLIITGKYPITQLNELNIPPMSDKISYVRPVFPAVNSSGVAVTQGDIAQHSDQVRSAYALDGSGVKVCVLSDSYNTVLGNPAQTDILNGDIPGVGGPGSQVPVHVIKEYPYGQLSDEGRAMLQIVHDIAPGAELGFRTGVISEGDLASGVIQSANAGCNILVDDISFLTSPFFQDGVIAQAVETVSAAGVSYFAAAGNFATHSYQSTFDEAPSPEGFDGVSHDFGGGDVMQRLSLAPGTYTIVLQWQDSIYSLGQSNSGTVNDFDIYLTNDLGTEYFGFNRNNLGGDPFEVLPFTVPGTATVQANIIIVRAAGSQAADIKFMAFRGAPEFLEHSTGTSTIVGQSNAESAITLGAVNYFSTPAFGVDPPEVTSFSSRGGTPVSGTIRQKPDLLAPNGVNTTVFLGTPDTDGNGDPFPNFYGTSAAAPHAAAVGALIMNAKSLYFGESTSPAEMKSILTSTALDIDIPGFDYVTGYGFLQAEVPIMNIAAPTPDLIELALEDSSIIPGTVPFTTIVTGEFFSITSEIIVGEDTIPTTYISSSVLSGVVPEFLGNPPVYVYTPPVTPSGLDGGDSDALYFFGEVPRVVTITAENKSKLFGEALPAFTASITVAGVPIENTLYTLESLGISALNFTTPATSSINSGIYFIAPSATITDSSFYELFDYQYVNGLLNIGKMPLTIIPTDTTIEYGALIDGLSFEFDYDYDDSNILLAERETFEMNVKNDHLSTMTKAIGLIDDEVLIDDRGVIRDDFVNLAFMATQRAVVSAQSFITQRPVVSGFTYDTTRVVFVSPESLFEYQVDDANADLFAAGPLLNRQRAVVSQRPVVSGQAFITQRPVVSGSALVNSSSTGESGDSDIAIIFDEDDANAPENDTIFVFKSINVITGINVGNHFIASAALLTSNFELSLDVGDLIITQAPLTLTADDISIPFSAPISFGYSGEGFKYDDSLETVISQDPLFTILDENDIPQDPNNLPVGVYTIRMSDAMQNSPENYSLIYEDGILVIEPNVITVTADMACMNQYDTLSAELTSTITGYTGDLDDIWVSGPTYYITDVYGTEFYPINLQFNNVGTVPGQYAIHPENLVLNDAENYVIEYVTGDLYVNPVGYSAMDIDIWLDCVDTLILNNQEFQYEAHFAYYNPNPITLCVPIGPNNNLSCSAPFIGEQPELFPPGYGSFSVLFDYTELTWNLNTYELFTLNHNYATASESSISCIPVLKALDGKPVKFIAQPNPSSGLITISLSEGDAVIKTIRVVDLLGSVHDIPVIFDKKDSNRTLDLSTLGQGVYLVHILYDQGEEVIRIIKE